MNYHSKDNKKNKKKLFLIVLLIIFLLFYSSVTNIFKNTFGFLFYPIWVTENYIDDNTMDPFGFFVSKKNLLISNKQLKEKLDKTELLLQDRILLFKENLELKKDFGRLKSENIILTAVLTKPNSSIYDSLIIDAGENLNLKVGDKAFVFGDILIGEVSEVSRKTSKVKLYSSAGETFEVMIGVHNINASAVGRGAGNFEIELPRETDVLVGDFVTFGGVYSKLLGSIEKIVSNPIDSSKKLYFKSPVNLFELKWVQVLKSE